VPKVSEVESFGTAKLLKHKIKIIFYYIRGTDVRGMTRGLASLSNVTGNL